MLHSYDPQISAVNVTGCLFLHLVYCPLSLLKPSFSLSDSPLALHKAQAADKKGMKRGLVSSRETVFNSFHFLSQGLMLFRGEASGRHLHPVGCGPF